MTSYYKVMLGAGGALLDECIEGGYIGADFDIRENLAESLTDDWRDFNRKFVPVYLSNAPRKTKEAAGLACGMLWKMCMGIAEGDVVLASKGADTFRVGQVTGPYFYVADTDYMAPDTDYIAPDAGLRHRRPVKWKPDLIGRADMSDSLKRSIGSIGTVVDLTQFAAEIESILDDPKGPGRVPDHPKIEESTSLTVERRLEAHLVANWSSTELGKTHRIYEIDGVQVGQQFATDTGRIDLLAISHDESEFLVIQIAKAGAGEAVVGQIQGCMGFVAQELAEAGQSVQGAILAVEDDLRIRRALVVAPNIEFIRYDISFHPRKV